MLPSKHNLVLYRGDTYVRTFTFAYADATTIDFTDGSARVLVKTAHDGDTLTELSTANGKLSFGDDPTLGVVTLSLTAAETSAFTWTLAVYDFQLTLADETVITPLAGSFVIQKDV